MAGTPNKRLRRLEYQKAQKAALEAQNAATQSSTLSNDLQAQQQDQSKKRKAGGEDGGDLPVRVELPKKKFYRQRAHANPFSDHALV